MTVDSSLENSSGKQIRSLLIEVAIVAACGLFLVFAAPLILEATGQGFRTEQLGKFMALAIAALGIDLIWGYTGLLSLGHGVFFTLGGYALAMHLTLQFPPGATSRLPEFMINVGVKDLPAFWEPFFSFPFTLAAIVLIPSLIGALLGFLVFRNRIRGVYFSILSQATTIIFFNFFTGQLKLINGTNGLNNFKTILGYSFTAPETKRFFYILIVFLLLLSYALCRWLTTGRFGRLLIAIRDDENRMRFSGYDPTGFKVLVFAISAGLAGIGGALFTTQTGIISPSNMSIPFSIEMVIWVAVGGRATLIGAVIGTLLVNFGSSGLSEKFPEVWSFLLGGMFLVVVMFLPDGLVGWLRWAYSEVLLKLKGKRNLVTYPSLEEDPEVQYERKNLGD